MSEAPTNAVTETARDLARDITRIIGAQTECLLLARLHREALVRRFDTGAYEWHSNGAIPPTKAEWKRRAARDLARLSH